MFYFPKKENSGCKFFTPFLPSQALSKGETHPFSVRQKSQQQKKTEGEHPLLAVKEAISDAQRDANSANSLSCTTF